MKCTPTEQLLFQHKVSQSMSYENRQVPEGINVSQEHPLKEFLLLAAGVVASIVALVMVLALLAEQMVRFIPFSVELELAEKYFDDIVISEQMTQDQRDITAYLQTLADNLAKAQQLPKEMTITVHYNDGDLVNAFATLGGNIVIYRGLLEKMPSENALAMVIAHEIAHIKHRDPIIALGRGITVSLALASLSGISGNAIFDSILGQTGALTALSFNREQEEEADDEALATLLRHYNHVDGAEAIFTLLDQQSSVSTPAFLSTHPVNKSRIEKVAAWQANYPAQTEVKALPALLLKQQ